MKYGVIDIGSNSVRLLIGEDGKGQRKLINTTRLAEDKKDGLLSRQSSLRTLKAVCEYVNIARDFGADEIYAFGTAALRNAKNGKDFVCETERECGVRIDILSGETEAEMGLLGVLGGGDGAVLDIGGGSTEIAVSENGKLVYLKSVPIGAVVLTEKCGQDYKAVLAEARRALGGFKEVAKLLQGEPYCIGGTCTSLAAVAQKLAVYDAEKVNGYKFTLEEIAGLAARISSLSVEERKALIGMQKERADIVHAGACIFQAVAESIGAKSFTVSESDNLEGYLNYKRRENEQKN